MNRRTDYKYFLICLVRSVLMNRSIISALLSVAMVLVMSSAAHALFKHIYSCANCHVMQDTASPITRENACLTCHNTAGVEARLPMDNGFMSNRFGSVPDAPDGPWSSHNWRAVAPYPAKAMVD